MKSNHSFQGSHAKIDETALKPLPQSQKVYLKGSSADILVPMREIALADTPAAFGVEKNPPLRVYDTSGPYTDPQADIDIRLGLKPLREGWIDARGDTDVMSGRTPHRGAVSRLTRFEITRPPRQAKPGKN